MTVKQAWQSWSKGGYRSSHTTAELFNLLDPVKYIGRFQEMPLLLVYSRRDAISPPEHAAAMRQAAPHADFLESKKASHIMLTLVPKVGEGIATWLKKQLVG
jgi:pimeloyl-ACP methyl ester carboxylesterase